MQLKTYLPNHSELAKYIVYYYEMETRDQSYYAYPHQFLPVSYISGVKTHLQSEFVIFEEDQHSAPAFVAIHKFTKPIYIQVKGCLREFCIVFKPHGLAQFINDALPQVLSKHGVQEGLFAPLVQRLEAITDKKVHQYIALTEEYLLSTLSRKRTTDLVELAISMLHTDDLSLDEIAKRCNCGSKTLSRAFINIVGANPSTFRKISRFRNSLEAIKERDKNFNLADVAFNNGYYDQPYFNREFKLLTGEQPSSFFERVEKYTAQNLYFKNVKKR